MFAVLDPTMKLQYYEDQEWEGEIVAATVRRFDEAYNKEYAPTPGQPTQPSEVVADSFIARLQGKRKRETLSNELNAYKAAEVAAYSENQSMVLSWWKVSVRPSKLAEIYCKQANSDIKF